MRNELTPFLATLIPLGWFLHDVVPELLGMALAGLGVLIVAALVCWALDWVRLARHRRRLERLEAFADDLPDGALDGRGFFERGNAQVRGRYRGSPVELRLALDEPRAQTVFRVRVAHPVARFDLSEPGLPARLTRARPRLRGRGPSGADLALEELDRATRFVLCGLGLASLRLGDDGMLVGRKAFRESDLTPARLRAVFDGLHRVAALCGRRRIAVRVLGGLSFVYTGAGGVRCPYCHDDVDPQREDLTACAACRTVHHIDCFAEAQGCTLLGCHGVTRAAVPVSAPAPKLAS